MKQFFLLMLLAGCQFSALAQTEPAAEEEVKTGGFKPELLFTGGNLNIGYFYGVTTLGATPQLGYSVTKWLDAGLVFGFTYTSQHDEVGTSYRQTIIGPGAFARIFPLDFLFATVQFERNFLRQKIIYSGGTETYKASVSSLLVGVGYTSGRESRNSPYYYFSVSVDVLKNPNSPYRDVVISDPYSPTGYYVNDIIPVIRAGFNIPLFQGNRRR